MIDGLQQIATIVEPFHRMFSLDNTALQFPHAEVERVSTSKKPTPTHSVTKEEPTQTDFVFARLEYNILRPYPVNIVGSMGRHCSTRSAQSPCYNSGPFHQLCSHFLPHRHHKELGRPSQTRSNCSLQTGKGYSGTYAGYYSCMHRNRSSYTAGWLEELPERPQ